MSLTINNGTPFLITIYKHWRWILIIYNYCRGKKTISSHKRISDSLITLFNRQWKLKFPLKFLLIQFLTFSLLNFLLFPKLKFENIIISNNLLIQRVLHELVKLFTFMSQVLLREVSPYLSRNFLSHIRFIYIRFSPCFT